MGAIVTLDALNAGLSGLENTLNPQILELPAKTQNQNALPLNTTFSGQLTRSPSTLITSSITLNPDSQNYIPNTTNFYDINTQNITNSLALTTNSLTTDKLSIDGNVNTSLNFGSTTNSYRECGIDYSSQIGTTINDLGSMNIRGLNINIGNSSQFSTITLNGYVVMPFMSNLFGFSINNGFISQI